MGRQLLAISLIKMHDMQVNTDSHIINVNITSNRNNTYITERKFDKGITVQALKDRLEVITGARSQLMKIEVFDANDSKVCDLKDDEALLGSLPIEAEGFRLHVTGDEHRVNELEDVSNVQKFELNPEEMKRLEEEKTAQDKEETELASKIKVDDRCEVKMPGNPTRRGTVKYVGEVHFKPGQWVGVQYDEPHGKNDGSVEGKRYFECPAKYGGFMRVTYVTIGDFPEEGFSDDEI